MDSIEVALTKSGLFAAWESGGGMTNTGTATIIANQDGSPKKPVFVRTGGHLSNSDHALFIVRERDVIIKVSRHRDDIDLKILEIKKFKEVKNYWFVCPKCGSRSVNHGNKCYGCLYESKEEFPTEYKDSKFEAVLEIVWESEYNNISEAPQKFQEAVKAAVDKSYDYHCRTPYFAK